MHQAFEDLFSVAINNTEQNQELLTKGDTYLISKTSYIAKPQIITYLSIAYKTHTSI